MNAESGQALTIERFESGNIEAARFDHAAHVYVGWLYVTKYELADAITRFDRALRRLTSKLGAPEKYHATITWLFLLLIAERTRANESWQSFESRNPDLIHDSKTMLQGYYSSGRLFSAAARSRFLLPDRTPANQRNC